jgi:hypothetical protein
LSKGALQGLSAHYAKAYRPDGVDPVENKIDTLTWIRRPEVKGIGVQGGRVAPVNLLHPPERILIRVQIRIRNDAGCHQIGVYAAWHLGLIGRRHSF